jgi:hypothetical protein
MGGRIVAQQATSARSQASTTNERDVQVRMIFGALAASAAIALAGCGGSSDTTAKFKSGYNAVRGPLDQTGQQIVGELKKASNETNSQVEAAFQSLAGRWGGEVTRLGKLTPPSDIQTDWNKVIQTATRIEADLLGVATAAKTNSTSLAQRSTTSLARNIYALQAAVAPIKTKLGLK